jgi:molybdopterin-binding protein
VVSITVVGSRARVGLAGPQPIVAELTVASAERLDLRAGVKVTATWKAAATRLVAA